jgi:hypothetical protein
MKLLIKWKDTGEEVVMPFGVLPDGQEGEDQPNDEQIFFWLTPEEATAIGADYDGGDWVVLRCACDECEILTCSNCAYETSEIDTNTELCQTCKNAYDLGWQGKERESV